VKKLILAMVFAITFVSLSFANPVSMPYHTTKTLMFDAVEDERITGYVVYFVQDGATEWVKRLPGKSNTTWEIPYGILYPGSTDVFTVTAHDAYENESAKSDPLTVYVEIGALPSENLPSPWEELEQPGEPGMN